MDAQHKKLYFIFQKDGDYGIFSADIVPFFTLQGMFNCISTRDSNGNVINHFDVKCVASAGAWALIRRPECYNLF